jgi:hypothetical protein
MTTEVKKSFYYLEGNFEDMCLQAFDAHFFCHQAVLCVHSKYCKRLIFGGDQSEKRATEFQTQGGHLMDPAELHSSVQIDDLDLFFKLMYRNTFPAAEYMKRLIPLAHIAKHFECGIVIGQIIDTMKHQVEKLEVDCWRGIVIGEIFDDENLWKVSIDKLNKMDRHKRYHANQLYEKYAHLCSSDSLLKLIETMSGRNVYYKRKLEDNRAEPIDEEDDYPPAKKPAIAKKHVCGSDEDDDEFPAKKPPVAKKPATLKK